MNISKLIYNATGRMTKKHIIRTAESVGTGLIQRAQKQGDSLQIKDIKEVLIEKLGKKKASKIIVSDSLQEFKDFSTQNLGLSEEMADFVYHSTKGAAVPGGGKVSKSFFKINLAEFNGLNELVNTVSHECEHLFFQNFSFRALFEKLYLKIRGPKWNQKFIEKYAQIINEKLHMLQLSLIEFAKVGDAALGGFTEHRNNLDGLLKQLGGKITTRKELHSKLLKSINKIATVDGNEKLSLKILRFIKQLLKDESRAYKVGGRVERSLYPKTDRATKSEMLATLYDETIAVLRKEIKTRQKNRIKKFFGLGKTSKKDPS